MRGRIISSNQPINQSSNQSVNRSIQCLLASKHTNQSINRSRNRLINQSTNQSINHCTNHQRHLHTCVHRSINQSINQSINKRLVTNQTTDQSIHPSINQSINQSINRSFSTLLHYDSSKRSDRTAVNPPINQSTNQPIHPSTNQAILQSINPDQPNDQSINQSTKQRVNTNQSTTQLFGQLINQSTHQSINQQVNQPTHQSINQPINQPNPSQVKQFPELPAYLNPANLPIEPSIIAPISFYRNRSINQSNTQSINQQTINPQTINQSINQPIKRVLIYKKVTTLEEIRRGLKNPVDFPYLRADAKVLLADREHSHTLDTVRHCLTRSGFEWREVETILTEDLTWCDVLMCVGGDGTFLKAQRAVTETIQRPMVGVNSAPSSSFGFFCAADHASIGVLCSRLIDGSALCAPLWRMRVHVNGVPIGPLILNEMLFCNPIPSGTTRYWLSDGGINQQQQSSGCWISTAAGSTGAIHGAGGELMNLSDSRFQYRIRELFSLPLTHPRDLPVDDEFPHLSFQPKTNQKRKVLSAGYCAQDFSLQSRMMSGCLYFDGSITAYPVSFNDTITLARSLTPLHWIAPTLKNDGKTVADHWELVTGLQREKLQTKQAQALKEQSKLYGFEQYNP